MNTKKLVWLLERCFNSTVTVEMKVFGYLFYKFRFLYNHTVDDVDWVNHTKKMTHSASSAIKLFLSLTIIVVKHHADQNFLTGSFEGNNKV